MQHNFLFLPKALCLYHSFQSPNFGQGKEGHIVLFLTCVSNPRCSLTSDGDTRFGKNRFGLARQHL